MQIVQAPRASAILYDLLVSQSNKKPWLLPANICPIVPITFFKAKIPFEFVDISAETLHIDLEQVEGQLERGVYGGVLYAHTYGEPSTPNEFFKRVKSNDPDLLLIDDRCLCIPDLAPTPEMVTDVALYSTGYAKTVDLGFGGYAFIQDSVIYKPEELPFNSDDYEEIEREYRQAIRDRIRYNYRDSNWLQTGIELPSWDDYCLQVETGLQDSIRIRTALNEIYSNRLPEEIQLPKKYQTWRYNIRLKNKQHILNSIFASGLFASSHYASLAGIMALGQCFHAEALASEIINLFNDHHFDMQKAEQVCTVIMENIS